MFTVRTPNGYDYFNEKISVRTQNEYNLFIRKEGKEANTLLIEATKDGNPDLKILPPLTVYQDNDEYTVEMREILYGE